jgi:hypothetical protein
MDAWVQVGLPTLEAIMNTSLTKLLTQSPRAVAEIKAGSKFLMYFIETRILTVKEFRSLEEVIVAVVKEATAGSKILAITRFQSPQTADVDHIPSYTLFWGRPDVESGAYVRAATGLERMQAAQNREERMGVFMGKLILGLTMKGSDPVLGLAELPGGDAQEGVPTSALGIIEADIPDELLSFIQQIVTP